MIYHAVVKLHVEYALEADNQEEAKAIVIKELQEQCDIENLYLESIDIEELKK